MRLSGDFHPKENCTSRNFMFGSTFSFDQVSISFQKFTRIGHSMKACHNVSEGSLQYVQPASVDIFIFTRVLFVMTIDLSSLYLVYALTGVLLMFLRVFSINSEWMTSFNTSDKFD